MNQSIWHLILTISFASPALASGPAGMGDRSGEAIVVAGLLRAARGVVASNKAYIRDPKNIQLTGKEFAELARSNFEKAGVAVGPGFGMTILGSIERVIDRARSGGYHRKWRNTIYERRFLPARFAREVALDFNRATRGKASVKVTAPDGKLVNPRNKADRWESQAIHGRFMKSDWPKDQVFTEATEVYGNKVYRFILPEYYNETCMGCHGGRDGSQIHTDREPGHLGELGGAISVSLY